jgi:hypothetical protein
LLLPQQQPAAPPELVPVPVPVAEVAVVLVAV